jgi:hypothetical protein
VGLNKKKPKIRNGIPIRQQVSIIGHSQLNCIKPKIRECKLRTWQGALKQEDIKETGMK